MTNIILTIEDAEKRVKHILNNEEIHYYTISNPFIENFGWIFLIEIYNKDTSLTGGSDAILVDKFNGEAVPIAQRYLKESVYYYQKENGYPPHIKNTEMYNYIYKNVFFEKKSILERVIEKLKHFKQKIKVLK